MTAADTKSILVMPDVHKALKMAAADEGVSVLDKADDLLRKQLIKPSKTVDSVPAKADAPVGQISKPGDDLAEPE